jgi:choline dehydrogenase
MKGNSSPLDIRIVMQFPITELFVVKASKEIIMSAGSVGTPHLLLNSGIGNKTSLEKHGIKMIVDLPDVGQNFIEQPMVGFS